jgi:transcriptional regulator with XRE-family HTH domain
MSTVADVDELDAVIAGRLRETLEEDGLRREDLAQRMAQLGFRWTGNTVTQVITGRRGLSPLELAGVCESFQRSVEELFGADRSVVLLDVEVDLRYIALALTHGGGAWTGELKHEVRGNEILAQLSRDLEAVVKAARRLGVPPDEVEKAAVHLWGHPFGIERDQRVTTEGLNLDSPAGRRGLQARRGHASRAMVEALRSYFDKEQER